MRSAIKKTTMTLVAISTQFVSDGGPAGVPVSRFSSISWSVDHPAATIAYTVQGSNMTDAEAAAGLDDWHDYSGITIPSKTAAEKFGINYGKVEYARVRLKAVTSVGTGVVTVRHTTKGPY